MVSSSSATTNAASNAKVVGTSATSTASAAIPPIDTNMASSPIGVNQPGGPSHEVLANFFQSLLVKKASSTSGGSSPTSLLGNTGLTGRESEEPNNTTPTAAPSSGTTRRPTISRKDVHKELDRMRQYVNKP